MSVQLFKGVTCVYDFGGILGHCKCIHLFKLLLRLVHISITRTATVYIEHISTKSEGGNTQLDTMAIVLHRDQFSNRTQRICSAAAPHSGHIA